MKKWWDNGGKWWENDGQMEKSQLKLAAISAFQMK